MSEMPGNEQEDEDHQTKQVMPKEFQEELIHVIQTSLINIATQVHILSNQAEHFLVQLSKEVDNTSLRLMALHKRVSKLMGVDSYKESYFEAKTSRNASETTPTVQVYSSPPLPVKMYKMLDAYGQTLSLKIPATYYQDDTSLNNFSDNSYSSGICKRDVTPNRKNQKPEKLKEQKRDFYHPSVPETVPPCQLMQSDASVDYSQADYGDLPHSLVHQAMASFSFSTHSFSEISELLMRAVGRALAIPLCSLGSGAKDVKVMPTYSNYRIGVGEKVEPQPPIRHRTEVFVNSTTPSSPPPLPLDWLALLREQKRAIASTIFHSPSKLPSSVSRTPTESHPPGIKTTPVEGLAITLPKGDLSSSVPKLVQYYKMVPHALPDEEKRSSPSLSSPPVIAHRTKSEDTDTNQVGRAPVTLPAASLGFVSTRSSFAQLPRYSITKLPRSSIPPTPKSTSPPSRYQVFFLSKSSTTPLSGHPTLTSSQRSAQLSSSGQQASRSFAPSGKHSGAQAPGHPFAQSGSVAAQPARSSGAPSERSAVAQSASPLIPPQQRSLHLKPRRSSMLQSLFSSAQSPSSCISHPQGLSLTQSSQAPVTPAIKQSSSTLTTFSKPSNSLEEAIRKGILPRKAGDYCVIKAKVDISKNEASSILIYHKAMEYNSGKLDTKAGWLEGKK